MVLCPHASHPLCDAKNQKPVDAMVIKISQVEWSGIIGVCGLASDRRHRPIDRKRTPCITPYSLRFLLLWKLLIPMPFQYHSHSKSCLPATWRETRGVEVRRVGEVTESDTAESLSLSPSIVEVGNTLTYSTCLLLISVANSQAKKTGWK